MSSIDLSSVPDVLQKHRTELAATEDQQQHIIDTIRKIISNRRSPDDKRQACLVAVDTSKQFITIATAVLVAIGTLITIAKGYGIGWVSFPMALFALSAIAVVISMALGFTSISRVYRRAGGLLQSSATAWDVEDTRLLLALQSQFGLLGLILLGLAFAAWGAASSPTGAALLVSMPSTISSPTAGPVQIDGQWTSLSLQPASGPAISIPSGMTPIVIECRP